MDPITHALSGMALHQLGFKRKYALFILIISAIAPDIDYIVRFWGVEYLIKYHRGITHSIFAAIAFPLLIGLFFKKRCGFVYAYSLSFIGYTLHIAFDITNSYGTMTLAPLVWERYSLDLTFIIDLYIFLGFLITVILGRLHPKKGLLIAVCCFLLLTGYLYCRYFFQTQTKTLLKSKIDAHTYRLVPMPNSVTGWWFITRRDNTFTTGIADIFLNRVLIAEHYSEIKRHPLIEKSKDNEVVMAFLSFARAPIATVNDNTVKWLDISYSFVDRDRFAVKVYFDDKGNVKNVKLTF